MITEHFFSCKDELNKALQDDVVTSLVSALSNKPRACIALSGGSSPKDLYNSLSLLDLDWGSIDVALVDERWVGIEHPASNEAFIRDSLAKNKAAAANLVSMKTRDHTAQLGLREIESRYEKLALPFDFTILGMGGDGHTASLFPAAKGLREALSDDCLISAIEAKKSPVTGANVERISLSLKGIFHSKKIVLLISGQEKLDVYQLAKTNTDETKMPVSAVLNQSETDIHVYWAP